MNIQVKFIWHDCFVITLPGCVIITDYWVDAPDGTPVASEFPDFLNDVPREAPLYVLVSHHHKDHFVKSIFSWASEFKNIRYIISRDTANFIKYLLKPGSTYNGKYSVDPERVTILKPGMEFYDKQLKIKAYGSTDIGNSYLIDYKGYTLFHAGDLNAWIWKDESTEQEVQKALGDFRAIISHVRLCTPYINVAFFPVDSRIGTDYWTGAKIFVHEIKTEYFLAMHFSLTGSREQLKQRISDATATQYYSNKHFGKYPKLTLPYESINLQLHKASET